MSQSIEQMRFSYNAMSLRRFRGFRSTGSIPLAPLTFLVGPNSSGKSSLCDALMLLAQSNLSPIGNFRPRWRGELVDLGSYEDTVYSHNSDTDFWIRATASLQLLPMPMSHKDPAKSPSTFDLWYRFSTTEAATQGYLKRLEVRDNASNTRLTLAYDPKGRIRVNVVGEVRVRFSMTVQERDESFGNWHSAVVERLRQMLPKERTPVDATPLLRLCSLLEHPNLPRLLRTTQRVSSGRGGPTRWYAPASTEAIYLGPSLFETINPRMLTDEQDARRPSDTQVQNRLAKVLAALSIADQITDAQISPYHTAIKVRDSVTGIISNLMEVGYGASQIIPVIRACLTGVQGTLFVEQPEIHLHPKAQGTIAELLCETSLSRQVIIETHSVHMVNRARLWVARGRLRPEHVSVLFVRRTKGGSRVQPIPVLRDGDFGAKWPGGFFDERYEDTMELLRLKQRRSSKT